MNARYARQIVLPNFGISAQAALSRAKVLVIGAGGLGCPALQYLAASGVGTIGIIDHDEIELSNLHRQILFDESDIGKNKAKVAAIKLQKSNSDLSIQVFETKIDNRNALGIIREYDIVIDGSDNFPTRYVVNDACAILKIPLIYGSVFRYEGQVSVFHSPSHIDNILDRAANYRDIFPVPPAKGEVPNCLETGVLGVLTGIVGTWQASEAIKLITGIGEVLSSTILTLNMLTNTIEHFTFELHPDALFGAPSNENELSHMNYDDFCGIKSDIQEITWKKFREIYSTESVILLDVRDEYEMPKVKKFTYKSIPMNDLQSRMHELDTTKTIVVFCQTGKRSIVAAFDLMAILKLQHVLSISGGINAIDEN
ncbi:MAG: HesA/MoeB/ThiF family protein [Ignavibacteria bacterium]|nr:HesA/MoeB/ThiF family protein [Ignavibacteria bacterium]